MNQPPTPQAKAMLLLVQLGKITLATGKNSLYIGTDATIKGKRYEIKAVVTVVEMDGKLKKRI